MKNLVFFILLTILTLSCTTNNDTQISPVQLRLANVSNFDYTNIIIRDGVQYEDLEMGSISEYQTFESSYSYMFVQLVINQDTLIIQPIDFVGESLVPSGNYTYEINVDFESNDIGNLNAILIRD